MVQQPLSVISGSRGFLGSHLITELKKNGHKILPIEQELLFDAQALQNFLTDNPPDYIFHFAAYGNHAHQVDESQTIISNVYATFNLLEASANFPYKAFINCSTSSVYGRKTAPMRETDILEPDTFYAATKAAGEHITRAFVNKYDKPILNIRPFSIFGEGEADFRFIPTAIKHMLEQTTMPFVASPTHDWTYVADFINAIIFLLPHVNGLKGQAINIGYGGLITNKDVVETLTYIADRGLKTAETYKEQPHHSSVWVADITKLKDLGWKPKYTFEEGLKATYDFYRKKYTK